MGELKTRLTRIERAVEKKPCAVCAGRSIVAKDHAEATELARPCPACGGVPDMILIDDVTERCRAEVAKAAALDAGGKALG